MIGFRRKGGKKGAQASQKGLQVMISANSSVSLFMPARQWVEEKRALSTGKYTGSSSNHGQNNNGKGPYFTRVARDSATRVISLSPSVRTTYPPSSVNAPFYGYSKLQLHGTEESRNRRRSNDGERTNDPPAQKAAHQPTELRLLL